MEIVDFIISLLPSNNIAFIVYLIIVPIIGVFIIFLFSRRKDETEKKLSLEELIKIAKYKKSTLSDLAFVLDYFANNFRVKDSEQKSFELFKLVLTHKNRGKVLFDIFHNKIVPNNLEYERILNKIEKEALR